MFVTIANEVLTLNYALIKSSPTISYRNCGIRDPSWSEIRHFVSFLNSQLRDCEQSFFCDMKLMRAVLAGPNVPNLEGFRSFVARFMIQMSRVRLVIQLLLILDITHPCLFILAQLATLMEDAILAPLLAFMHYLCRCSN